MKTMILVMTAMVMLSDEDMGTVNAMEYCGGSGLNADEVEF